MPAQASIISTRIDITLPTGTNRPQPKPAQPIEISRIFGMDETRSPSFTFSQQVDRLGTRSPAKRKHGMEIPSASELQTEQDCQT